MIRSPRLPALAVALALALPARAQGPAPAAGARVALLAPELVGPSADDAGARLLAHLQAGLARGAFAVIAPDELGDLARACDAACVRRIGRDTGAVYLLRSRIAVDDRDYVVRLDLLATEGADVVATSEERCDLCGLAEVGALLEAQGARLRATLEDLIRGAPILVVTTAPSGAMVFIDDALVGLTPLERTMIEGDHVVRVTYDGYVSEQRDVALVAGVRSNLDIPLRRTPETAKRRAFGIAALAVGAPLLAVTPALLLFDGDPVRRRCTGDEVDADGDCALLHNTDWLAVLTAGAGAALVTLGVTLVVLTRDRGKPRARARAQVQAGLTPTGLTLRARF